MTPDDLKARTKQCALRVIKVVQSLGTDVASRRIGDQLLRSATSVGANYRAACRARSPAEFRAKLGIVEEEADESIYWMELLVETSLVKGALLQPLIDEGNEILSIIVASLDTSSKRPTKKASPHTAK
ncbi:MAG: four helix bundle protein [Planctomycetaceae bacterium]|nr:four helix bundle protein [Planctomycetaceae bacterium]